MNLKKSERKDHFGGKQWKSEYEKFTNKNLSFRIEQKVFLAAVDTIDKKIVRQFDDNSLSTCLNLANIRD